MIIELGNVYRNSPNWLRQCVRVLPFNYRLGKTYRRTLQFLRESDRWDKEQYRRYQAVQLALLLEQTIELVPFYQRYHRLLGRDPFDILRDIEPVTKQQMQENLDRFVMPEPLRGKWHTTYTGGSSGLPLTIYLDNHAVEREWAFMISQWSRVGYRPGDKRIASRSSDLLTSDNAPIVANPVYNEYLCSPLHLEEENLYVYIDLIRKFRPAFLRGYPSVLTVLARFVEDNQLADLPPLKALLCGSEGITPNQRTYLERIFRARVFSWYGMSEKVVLAGQCEQSSHYHCFPQYGITEIIDSSGNVSSQPGSQGEIVGTGFLNRVMPFIRYRLDDLATIVADQCSACGRQHMLLSAITSHRQQNDIVGKSGARISMTVINVHDDSFHGVRQFQFHQQKQGTVNVYLRVSSGFDEERRQLIWKSLTRRTRGDIDYHIQIVDSIEQTGLGKGIYLRQELIISDTTNQSTTRTLQQKEQQDEHTRMD